MSACAPEKDIMESKDTSTKLCPRVHYRLPWAAVLQPRETINITLVALGRGAAPT